MIECIVRQNKQTHPETFIEVKLFGQAEVSLFVTRAFNNAYACIAESSNRSGRRDQRRRGIRSGISKRSGVKPAKYGSVGPWAEWDCRSCPVGAKSSLRL